MFVLKGSEYSSFVSSACLFCCERKPEIWSLEWWKFTAFIFRLTWQKWRTPINFEAGFSSKEVRLITPTITCVELWSTPHMLTCLDWIYTQWCLFGDFEGIDMYVDQFETSILWDACKPECQFSGDCTFFDCTLFRWGLCVWKEDEDWIYWTLCANLDGLWLCISSKDDDIGRVWRGGWTDPDSIVAGLDPYFVPVEANHLISSKKGTTVVGDILTACEGQANLSKHVWYCGVQKIWSWSVSVSNLSSQKNCGLQPSCSYLTFGLYHDLRWEGFHVSTVVWLTTFSWSLCTCSNCQALQQ